jgi:predicted nucleic acid-binding protein
MSGNKYLLDTNFILGILKSDPIVLAQISKRQLRVGECSYSAITRMELLGFQGITREEAALISQKLDCLTYLPLTEHIANVVIDLRQARKIKLPDAIIAATALCSRIELLSLDQHLLSVVNSSAKLK